MNKVIFITGAAGGIGFEIARQFAKEGAKVVISDLNTDALKNAEADLNKQGRKVSSVQLDVTDENNIRRAYDTVLNIHGRIDILVNNAGLQHISPIEDFPTEKFEQLLKVMLTGPFMMIKHIFPLMKKQQFGRIINIASINGVIGFAGKAAYNSAKHGVIGLTKVAALEGALYNITVNALCPGYVDTDLVRDQLYTLAKSKDISVDRILDEVIFPLVPQKRLLSVDEIANYVLFLAGEKARGITGQAILIDGGYTAQ